VSTRSAVGIRVIIIVDVDIVIVYYLNDFARGALPELAQLQLAESKSIKLLLELFI
jgi:hypothetical protein